MTELPYNETRTLAWFNMMSLHALLVLRDLCESIPETYEEHPQARLLLAWANAEIARRIPVQF